MIAAMDSEMDPLDRLRRLQQLRPTRTPTSSFLKPREKVSAVYGENNAPEAPRASARRRAALEELVTGAEWENEAGALFVSIERYPLAQVRGAHAIDNLLAFAPTTIAPLHPNAAPAIPANFRHALFLDTETTGLGAGASTYAFMVGVGTIEPSATGASEPAQDAPPLELVVRQLFMRSPAEETALLVALADLMRECDLLVTFNGRTFDVPLLRMRYLYNRSFLPESARSVALFGERAPHLDLLHPARRIWKRRLQSCRLVNLEAQVLGATRSGEDVEGALIPQMYVDYVKSGNGWEMSRVFYHNREDIVTTAALAAQMGRLILTPNAPDSGITSCEWLALGARFEAETRYEEAVAAYRRALEEGSAVRADAFAALARTQKRSGAWEDAAATWELWLTTLPDATIAPYLELAKYHEWRTRDFAQAAMWTAWALHVINNQPMWQRPPGVQTELALRLARLDKKLGKREA
jgi:uncharacterized protein YprB with RNaseH-like and TPR domain